MSLAFVSVLVAARSRYVSSAKRLENVG